MTSVLSTVAKLDPLTGKAWKALGLLPGDQGTPATPAAVVIPPPPTLGTATDSKNVQEAEDKLRQRQGRAANLNTGTSGVNATPVGTKALLGQ